MTGGHLLGGVICIFAVCCSGGNRALLQETGGAHIRKAKSEHSRAPASVSAIDAAGPGKLRAEYSGEGRPYSRDAASTADPTFGQVSPGLRPASRGQ